MPPWHVLSTLCFAQLGLQQLHRLMRVCREWRTLARAAELYRTVILHSGWSPITIGTPGQDIWHLHGRRKSVSQLTDEVIRRILTLAAGGLTHLCLTGLSAITHEGLTLLHSQPRLQHVELVGCAGVTADVIHVLPNSVCTLALHGCQISVSDMANLSRSGMTLDIFLCTECGRVGSERIICSGCRLDRCELCTTACSECEQSWCGTCDATMHSCNGCGGTFCEDCTTFEPCRNPNCNGDQVTSSSGGNMWFNSPTQFCTACKDEPDSELYIVGGRTVGKDLHCSALFGCARCDTKLVQWYSGIKKRQH